MGRYLEQFERVKRWYQRFKATNDGREHNIPSDFYLDEVYAFFISCHHMKDWIKNDSSTRTIGRKVEGFVGRSSFLKICGDLANGSKHLEIMDPKMDKDTKIRAKHYDLTLEVGTQTAPIIKAKYEVTSGSTNYDAFDLATNCLREWEQFMSQNGLLPQSQHHLNGP